MLMQDWFISVVKLNIPYVCDSCKMMYLMFISGIIKMSWMLITGDSIPETTANYVFTHIF